MTYSERSYNGFYKLGIFYLKAAGEAIDALT